MLPRSTVGAGLLANAVGQRRKCRLAKPVRQQAGSYKCVALRLTCICPDHATFEEKERVYLEVMEKAWARQDKIIEQARKM
jgi:hypothetical protein